MSELLKGALQIISQSEDDCLEPDELYKELSIYLFKYLESGKHLSFDSVSNETWDYSDATDENSLRESLAFCNGILFAISLAKETNTVADVGDLTKLLVGLLTKSFANMASEESYYVYKVTVDGDIKYVGKGCGNRIKHASSGRSSCVALNKDHAKGLNIQSEIIEDGLSETEALALEKEMIECYVMEGYNLYNIRGVK